jgi:flavodoxin
LVVYDSLFGNTAEIAKTIADTLTAHGSVALLSVNAVSALDLEGASLVVVGCPTQRRRVSLAVQALLDCLPPHRLAGVQVVAFDTRYDQPRWFSGSAARRLVRRLAKLGGSVLLPPESFFVVAREGPLKPGERERAATWSHLILDRLAALDARPAPPPRGVWGFQVP